MRCHSVRLVGTRLFCTTPDPRIPVTLLSGFLGSGKTTVLNQLLQQPHGKRVAVVQNEFGDTSVDDTLVAHHFEPGDDILYTSNGCLCCTSRSDLEPALFKLHREHLSRPLDAIVIETTGLAKPSAIAETILALADFCRMDAVITLVDAVNVELQLGMSGGEAVAQALFADKIVLNKCDLIDQAEEGRLTQLLQGLNPSAPVYATSHGQVPIDQLLGLRAFDLENVAQVKAQHATQGHSHQAGASSLSIEIEDVTLHMPRLQEWILGLSENFGNSIWRIKGVLSVQLEDGGIPEKRKLVFQSVHGLVNGDWVDEWPEHEPRKSRLVFIGDSIDKVALRKSFDKCIVKSV